MVDKSSRTLSCQILTPDRTVFRGEVDRLVVTAVDGELGILPRHAPLVGALSLGEARITTGAETRKFVIFGGLVEVLDNQAVVLAAGAADVATLDPVVVRRQLAEAEAETPEGAAATADRQRRIDHARACLKVLEGGMAREEAH